MTKRSDDTGHCVVCGRAVSEPVWPNAWERAERRRACCSHDCASRFDPDRHWLPSRAPEPLADDARDAMVAAGKRRMRAGDEARPVARDLLSAGVPPWMVRNAVVDAGARARADSRERGILPLLTLGRFFETRAPSTHHDPSAGGDALADVDQWIARFGER